MSENEKLDRLEELKGIYLGLEDKMGEDIKIIDISKISSLTSYFVIVNGNNVNQLDALADNVEEELKKIGVPLRQGEGYGTNWVLLDFEFAIIHIFNKENREHFNLERLWADGDIVDNQLLKN